MKILITALPYFKLIFKVISFFSNLIKVVVIGILFLSQTAGASEIDPTKYPYYKKNKIEIDSELLGKCFALEVSKNSSAPDFKLSGSSCSPTFDKAQFFVYLGAFPNHCEFETGKEGELRKWIMHQPDNSVDPLMLFKRSLLINRSNPFNAILTIHQLLRNEARYYKTNYYNYSSDPEKERLFFNKLVDIRGDLAERGGDSHGDHEGTRYRIWGIMLYRISSNTSANHAVCDSGFSNTYNDLKTSVMAVLAELLKTLSSKPLGDKRKMEINLVGANIANSMIDSMRDPELLSDRVRLEHLCDNRLYIKYSK